MGCKLSVLSFIGWIVSKRDIATDNSSGGVVAAQIRGMLLFQPRERGVKSGII